jgi:hypothetical protein
MILIQLISRKFNFINEDETKSLLLQRLHTFWKQKITAPSSSNNAKMRATLLSSVVSAVINSRPTGIILETSLQWYNEIC